VSHPGDYDSDFGSGLWADEKPPIRYTDGSGVYTDEERAARAGVSVEEYRARQKERQQHAERWRRQHEP